MDNRTDYECSQAPFNREPDCIARNASALSRCNSKPTSFGVLMCRWDVD